MRCFQLEMPRETRIVWNEGEPAEAIVAAAEKEGVDLLIASALEGKEVASSSFLGCPPQKIECHDFGQSLKRFVA
jgi:hypothetical protein